MKSQKVNDLACSSSGLSKSVDSGLLYLTLDTLEDGIVLMDNIGHVTFMNKVAGDITGWNTMDVVGLPATECLKLNDKVTGESLPLQFWCELTDKPSNKTVSFPDEASLMSKEGQRYMVSGAITSLSSLDSADQGYVVSFRNVTEQRTLDKDMQWHATHDALTGLANRTLLADRFKQAIQSASRQNTLLAVCLLDLDNFKPINDEFGHQAGDDVLLEVSARLGRSVREGDTVARLGGDEFVLLLGGSSNKVELYQVIERIQNALAKDVIIEGNTVSVTCSIGISVYPDYDGDADSLLRYADQAMYTAKRAGRNRIHWFDDTDEQQKQGVEDKINEIAQAMNAGELELFYQPKVNMRTGQIVGMEALLRWRHPTKGLVPPLEFLTLIEQHDLIIDIGDWVIDAALRQLSIWRQQKKDWSVSVNIAARHLHINDFSTRLMNHFQHYPDVEPRFLEIEILESVALNNIQHIQAVISECQKLGVSFALDDFGTGYSSLSYLKRLPVNTLKIDQTFVRDILDDKDDLALVQAISGLAATFSKQVVAEGVETIEQGSLVMRLGCDVAQGYGIARPMPENEVLPWAAHFVADSAWELWSNVDWDLKDFPLLVAQHDIREWVQGVIGKVEARLMLPSQVRLSDENHCRFGMWYKDSGMARYANMQIFKDIDPIHHEFHKIGDDVLNLYAKGDIELAVKKCRELHKVKDNLLTKLDDLQIAACSVK
jgi:diguanylate cyclase (GGDEF)-like protein/PAS domain S-box-containing protein